ncbi:MAG: minor capsid protein [Armatimonadota bacterium]
MSSPLGELCVVADITRQAKAIREATNKSLMARDKYTEQVAYQLTQSLKSAQNQVHKAFLSYSDTGLLPDNKLAAVKGLEKLNYQIQETVRTLRKKQSLIFKQSSKAAFRKGVYQGIEEFASAQMPFYRDLTPDGVDKLTTSVFTLIDTDALDFLANYTIVLIDDVGTELESGIKRTILSGIINGKGARDIVRDLGSVIEDKESFRNAGSKVFSKAQYRMEMIARTEVLRAHNQGRIKFHKQVGVQKLEWMTMEDERTCPVCGALDGKQFDIDKFPNIPTHPMCRCSCLPAWPLVICGGQPDEAAAGDKPACILPPQTIHEQAKKQASN